MIPICTAWGAPTLFGVADEAIWGCQFDVLPGASMLNAPCLLTGIIGLAATVDPHGAEPIYRTLPGASLAIYAIGHTEPADLEPFQDQIVQAYREHLMRLGIASGA